MIELREVADPPSQYSAATTHRVAVAPGNRARGVDAGRPNAPLSYQVTELTTALNTEYDFDAHLVSYVVTGATRQPRINKGGLATFPREVRIGVFFCDVDNPGKAKWTPEGIRHLRDLHRQNELLETAGIYATRSGYRIVQPLSELLPVQAAERVYENWLHNLSASGIDPDWKCRDWTRHFRAPHVVRDEERYRSPFVDLSRMRPVDPGDLGCAAVTSPPKAGIGIARPHSSRKVVSTRASTSCARCAMMAGGAS